MINADTSHFTFAQLADLRDVVNGRCGEPDSTAVVNALKSNLGSQYRPSRATICTSGHAVIGPHVATDDDLHILVDELSIYMSQADITEPVRIEYEFFGSRGQVVVNGHEDARYSGMMVDKAMTAMKANAEITNARTMLQNYKYIDDEERGSLVIQGARQALTLTYGFEGCWTIRLYHNAFEALDIRNVVEVRDGFPTLVAALEHIGPEV